MIVSFFVTGLFAYVMAGYFAQYQHLVCKQTELSLRLFEATQCEVDDVFRPESIRINQEWPFVHRVRPINAATLAGI